MIIDLALERLGWDSAWEEAHAPFAALGLRPARVVAVHRDTSIVRDARGDRPAAVSGAFRYAALAQSDFPTVGDWVALDAGDVVAAILPRRSVFKRMATDASRNGARLDDEQIMASNVEVALLVAGLDNDFNLRRIERYLAVAWSSEVTPVVVLNKSDLADDVDGRLVAVDAIAPGVAVVAVSRPGPAPVSMSCAGISGGARPRRSWARRASASRPSSTRCSARTARRRPRCADPTRGAATRRPIVSCSSCRAALSSSTRRASGRSRCSAPTKASMSRSTTSSTSRRPAGSAIVGTMANRAARSESPWPMAA